MAAWIKQPWIETALKSSANSLPKIARAQVLKIEERSNIAVISDKKLFVKAEFSPTAIKQFKRDNASLQLSDIQGGLIFVKKYSVHATAENELENAEFVINIDEFKFAGGEGNTQFGSDVIDSSTHPQLKSRLWQLWRAEQLRRQLVGGEADILDSKEAERLLLRNHRQVFIPDVMESKLDEIPEWKSNYFPPQTYEMPSDISSLEGQVQEQSCPNSIDLAGHATTEKELEECNSQECLFEDNLLVSSSFVPSSQRESCVAVEQPLKGLFPEELCSSLIRGSSEGSYSILQRRSSLAENRPDVSVVPSSQNSHEFELEQELPLVTLERKQLYCSLSESQLESFLDASISLDEVRGSPSILEGSTQIKPRDVSRMQSTSSDKSKSISKSSHLKTVADELSLASSGGLEKKTQSNKKDSGSSQVVTEVVVVSFSRDYVRDPLNKKEGLEKAEVDFDTLFSQNTWKLSQTAMHEEFSADVVEIDKRQSVKRKRSEEDDSKRKLPGSSDGLIQIRKLSFPNSPVSPDSTSGSLKSSCQSVSSQSEQSNQSFTKPQDLYTQQDPLVLDTSAGSTESVKSPAQNQENSPSILHISIEEPCTFSTPNFDSLPSYQVPSETKTRLFHDTSSPLSRDLRDEVTLQVPAEMKARQFNDTSSPLSRDQRDELSASTTEKWEPGPPQEPGACREVAENVVKAAGVKKRRKARRKFNWFSDAY